MPASPTISSIDSREDVLPATLTQKPLNRPKAILFGDAPELLKQIWTPSCLQRLSAIFDIHDDVISTCELANHRELLTEVEVILSSWSMPAITEEDLDLLPKLKVLFYAAGSVKHFASSLFARNITVVSAWAANAIPVAEFTLSQIFFALKSGWQHHRYLRTHQGPEGWTQLPITGAYGATVGIISLGMIGRRVCELLRPFDLKIIASDPYANQSLAQELNVELTNLPRIFTNADVVSLHAPLLPETVGMITGEHLASMRPNATFINTARGQVVREDELVEVMRARPDLTSVLDVACDEPPLKSSGLYDLPNIVLTPHIAGSKGNEVRRMADLMVEECLAWHEGRDLRYAVGVDDLDRIA